MSEEKKILLLGAGRSTAYLVKYLRENCQKKRWYVTIADKSFSHAKEKANFQNSKAVEANILDHQRLMSLISENDLIISMLPAHLHIHVAQYCLKYKKNMVTASYLTEEMKELDLDAQDAGITILNEIGLDPGLDHISAVDMIEDKKSQGYKITEFESFTGGLLTPDSENNPWKYKFTWNPRNVVLAGQGGAVKFIQNGRYKFVPYHKVFRRTEIIEIPNYGRYEGYANRNSLKYRETYGLEDVVTMYRGTLRRPGFSKAWNCFVELGATDDSYILPDSENMTHRDFINTFLAFHETDSVELKLRQYLKIDQDDTELWERLNYLGIFDQTPIGIKNATPAQILEHILMKKWSLSEEDRDMIVMWHKIVGEKEGQSHTWHAYLTVEGEDVEHTAMAKTVGLPLALAAELLLQGGIQTKGTILPVEKEIYIPLLQRLKDFDIKFLEKQMP
jgi:saccharopine dehydrogenase-like NADP-dependent oxidoreductase